MDEEYRFDGENAKSRYADIKTSQEASLRCRYRTPASLEGYNNFCFGVGSHLAYVYLEQSKEPGSTETVWALETSPSEQAYMLFLPFIEWLDGRRSLINSDPMSAEYFETVPEFDDLALQLGVVLQEEFNWDSM
jgi:hypothetical protein